ncbi:MAG TPA: MFS transporter [Casimicrobiaceae bacterium]|nr:MFS transporter [Casimicrobiaceae bacterium]
MDSGDAQPSLAATVAALGIAQIVSWGTLFYTIAVLGRAMREATGVSEIVMYGAYSAGLAISGLLAPWVGRTIDRRGGRIVLSWGSVAAAVACLALAAVQGPATLVLAWLMAGAAMAATLYDPAFATLHQLAGPSYRRAVTALTLFGGLASTASWPASQWLLDAHGFRVAFVVYALLNLVLCLPLHLAFVPRHGVAGDGAHAAPDAAAPAPPDDARRAYLWLAVALTGASFTASALAAHMIEVLTQRGLDAADAVVVGALIGPMQVAGRILEFALGRVIRPLVAGTLAFAALAASLVLLTQLSGGFVPAVLFAVLYGASNGVMTIVRGTVPAELFGRRDYGALLGRLAQPQFIARAIAPAGFALLVAFDPQRGLALAALAGCAVLAWIAYQRAVAR